jgi:hypothetical protein
MARDHNGDVKQFTIHTESWYYSPDGSNRLPDGVTESMMVGFYSPDGGTSGEFEIRWEMVANHIAMRVHAFSDGMSALANMPELLQWFVDIDDDAGSNRSDPSPKEFAEALKAMGFQDRTKRNRNKPDEPWYY